MIIEIITTENTNLKETGFGVHASCMNVLASVERIHSARVTVCSSPSDLSRVLGRKPDLVFLAAKYMLVEGGSDIWFSDYFDKNGITFSGSNRETLKYDSNKVLAKKCLERIGVKTAGYFTAIPGQFKKGQNLPLLFPLFLKPLDAANGNGIDDHSFVKNFAEFEAKLASLYEAYDSPVLVEEYLGGKEFTVALIKKSNGELITSAIEILPPESGDGLRILGAAVKKFDTENLMTIHPNDIEKVTELAVAAFRGLGVRGFGRIDVKMDSSGNCFFLEANLVPGMTVSSSYFPRACEIANDLTYDAVVCLMLDECLRRAAARLELAKLSKDGISRLRRLAGSPKYAIGEKDIGDSRSENVAFVRDSA